MANEFDPYREALVVEQVTHWPDDYDDWEPNARERVEHLLHSTPSDAVSLAYVRQHTGFRREITVTPTDLERLGA